MRPTSVRPIVPLFVALLLLVPAPGQELSAQAVDVTGTWVFDVETNAGGGTPTVTLEQEGETLTGHYSSANLGEADLEGRVDGSEIRFSFTTSAQGQTLTVVYQGAVTGEDSMEGTIDLGGMAGGTFTASRR